MIVANIIHSKERRDRLEFLIDQAVTYKMSFRLWPAIFDKPVQTGISRAHKQIVRWAKEKDLDEVWIMEDDCKFTSPRSLEYFFKNKPEDYSIYLGGISRGRILGKTVSDFNGLHCYMVHKSFYDTFLALDESIHIDIALSNLKIEFACCFPMVAIQLDGFSDNKGMNVKYPVPEKILL